MTMTPELLKSYNDAYAKALSHLNWEANIWYDVPAEARPEMPAWLRVLPLLSTLPFVTPKKADVSEARRAVGETWKQLGGPDLYQIDLSAVSPLDRVALYTFRAWQQHFDGSSSWCIRLDQATDAYREHNIMEQAARLAAAR